MTLTLDPAFLFGAFGAAATITSNLMRRMVPLRVFAIAANVMFLGHALLQRNWILVALHASLLVINAYRLWDLKHLLKAMADAKADSPIENWLLPHMRRRTFPAGTVLFERGDAAHELFFVCRGALKVADFGHVLGPGSLVGEIGLFSEERERTATVVCETDCICYTITDEAIYLLYFQNPQLGFYLIRLIVQRLLRDLQHDPKGATA